MRWFVCLAALVALDGCVNFGLDPSADGGADGGADAAASSSDADLDATSGSNCATDPLSGAVLCAAISLCPQTKVDRDQFPDCGFRIHGDAIDLECSCQGALCAMGSAATCEQAAALLSGQSEQGVCTQVSEGRCIGQPQPSGSSNCDPSCASDCAGDPTCMQMCGC
jgi:hypothetical protein